MATEKPGSPQHGSRQHLGAWLLATGAIVLLLAPGVSKAQEPEWRSALADEGLTGAERVLEREDRTAETAFLLGGVRFLRAFETILQTRYAHYTGEAPFVPGMNMPLPANPDAEFDPAFVETAMSGALDNLNDAADALAATVEGEFAVEVSLGDIWFDIDANGERAEWESFGVLSEGAVGATAASPKKGAATGPAAAGDVVRFDTADADWLMAYVHVTSGVAELILSVNPTPAIETVANGRAALDQFGVTDNFGERDWIETAATVLMTLRGEPDAERTRSAHAHFKAMIDHNRAFWTEVALETDDDREWLPNAQQTSSLGGPVNAETAQSWQGVLDEIDAMLDGEKLIPYWRVTRPEWDNNGSSENVGVNLQRLLNDPGDMDVILWIQGAAAAPYLERGELVDMEAWSRFEQNTFGGNSFIFALWMN